MSKTRKIVLVIIFFALMIATTIILYNMDQKNNQFIIQIDDTRISLNEYTVYSKILKNDIEEEYIEKNGIANLEDLWKSQLYGVNATDYLRDQTIAFIKKHIICHNKFNEMELTLSDSTKKKFDDEILLDSTIKKVNNMGITIEEYRQYLTLEAEYETLADFLTENIFISDSEAKDYIASHNNGSIYTIKRMIFSTRDNSTLAEVHTDEEKKTIYAKAELVHEKLENKEKFTELSIQYSDNTATYKPGDEYKFIEGTADNKKLEEIAKQLSIGQYSTIFESTLGYEIIELENVIKSTDNIYLDEIKQIIFETKKQESFNKEYDKWTRLSNIEINNSIINNINV